MTIKGDLVSALVSKGKTEEEARELLYYIFDIVNGPDFALKYESPTEYWEVIAFLKSTI